MTTCRFTSRSKKPRNADRCRFRLAAEPPRPARHLLPRPGPGREPPAGPARDGRRPRRLRRRPSCRSGPQGERPCSSRTQGPLHRVRPPRPPGRRLQGRVRLRYHPRPGGRRARHGPEEELGLVDLLGGPAEVGTDLMGRGLRASRRVPGGVAREVAVAVVEPRCHTRGRLCSPGVASAPIVASCPTGGSGLGTSGVVPHAIVVPGSPAHSRLGPSGRPGEGTPRIGAGAGRSCLSTRDPRETDDDYGNQESSEQYLIYSTDVSGLKVRA
jgi:hypothetical protein